MATVKVIREEPVPVVQPVKEVVLRLSKDEAESLFAMLGQHLWVKRGPEFDTAVAIRNALYAHNAGLPGQFHL